MRYREWPGLFERLGIVGCGAGVYEENVQRLSCGIVRDVRFTGNEDTIQPYIMGTSPIAMI